MSDLKVLGEEARKRALDALELLMASLSTVSPYDAAKPYTPSEREPYDALCDRYIRAVEICIKFFRTYERYLYAEISETLRDLLNRMEKLSVVESTLRWIEMRDLRNRIVHDYLPERLHEIYSLILNEYGPELSRVKDGISAIEFKE